MTNGVRRRIKRNSLRFEKIHREEKEREKRERECECGEKER